MTTEELSIWIELRDAIKATEWREEIAEDAAKQLAEIEEVLKEHGI